LLIKFADLGRDLLEPIVAFELSARRGLLPRVADSLVSLVAFLDAGRR